MTVNAKFQTVNISSSFFFFFFFPHRNAFIIINVNKLRTSVSNPDFCQRLNSFYTVVYWEQVLCYYQVFNIYIYIIIIIIYIFYIAINGIKVEYGILKITLQNHTG